MVKNEKSLQKVVLIYVEGDTEKEFFEKLYQNWKKRKNIKIIIKNVKGIGNYQKKPYNHFKTTVKTKFGNCCYNIFFAYDSDVFEFSPKPPVDWKAVEKQFRKHKKAICYHLKAIKNTEDWLFIDFEGLCDFLKLNPEKNKVKGKTGLEKIEKLFKRANKTYIKGTKVEGLLNKLNLKKIYKAKKDILETLKKAITE
jgi:hypothetical protein